MVPKDLNAFLTFVHAADTANSRFGTNSSPQKVWHFLEGTHPTPLKHEISTLPTKSQTFYTINIFFW